MSRAEKFWDRIAARYERTPIKDTASYEEKLAITRRFFTPDTLALEVGCGTGSTAIEHAPYVKHIHATDISGRMIEIAREKAAAAGIGNASFEKSDLAGLSGIPGRYDAVLCLNVIHLLEQPQTALAQIQHLLKDGGVLVSSTACLGDRQSYLKPLLWLGSVLGAIPSVQIFSTGQLHNMLAATGFRIEHEWQPSKSPVSFIVARKDATSGTKGQVKLK